MGHTYSFVVPTIVLYDNHFDLQMCSTCLITRLGSVVLLKLVQQVSPVTVDVLPQLFNGGRFYHTNSVGQLVNDITTSDTLPVS